MGTGMFVISVLSGWKLLSGPLGLSNSGMPAWVDIQKDIDDKFVKAEDRITRRLEQGRDEIYERLKAFSDVTRDLQNVTRDLQRQIDQLYRGR